MLQRHESDSYRMFTKCFKSHKTLPLFYADATSNNRISSFNNTNVNPFFFYKSKKCLTVKVQQPCGHLLQLMSAAALKRQSGKPEKLGTLALAVSATGNTVSPFFTVPR